MKKFLVYGFLFSTLVQIAAYASYSFDGLDEVRNYIFADEVEKAAKELSTSNTYSNTILMINKSKKVSELKKQLELQQYKLTEIQSDSDDTLVKRYRKKRIESKIADIENQIKELEK